MYEKFPSELIQRRRRLHEMQRDAAKRHAQTAQHDSKSHRQQKPLQQNLPQRRTIAASGGLCGKPGGAHAQKPHGPGQQGVQAGADRHRTQLMGVGQVTDDGAVDQRHQWHGNIERIIGAASAQTLR